MPRTVLINADIFDSLKGVVKSDETIVLNGDKIVWRGASSSFEKEEGDEIFDLQDKLLLPGLMDIHIHLDGGFKDIMNMDAMIMRNKTSMYAYKALKNSQEYIKSGITTVRDCGSFGMNIHSSLRTALHSKMFYGPRLLASQIPIAQFGNQEAFGPDHFLDAEMKYETTSGVDGMIHAVRDRRRSGSDFIKTMTTGGVLHGQGSMVNQSLFNDDELEAMVREAEKFGMHVAAHAHGDAGINSAVRNGIRTIEHGTLISEESVDLMLKKGTFLVPTQSAGGFIKSIPEKMRATLPVEIINKANEIAEQMIEKQRVAYEKGVPIAIGTDAPVSGEHTHTSKEMELLVKNMGMSNIEVLQSATIVSARAIKKDSTLGSLDVGKQADVVVLNKTVLEDITFLNNNQNIDFVFRDGTLMSKNGKLETV